MALPLAVPLAVCEAAEELEPGTRCGVKWPNDVLVDGRKLAGVLIEARPRDGWAVVGVGLNLAIAPEDFPPALRETAASILSAPPPTDSAVSSARHADMRNSAKESLDRCLARWVAADVGDVLNAWRERDALRGREVAWDGGSGVADGIDDRGYLVVVTAAGDRVAIGAGEVHLTVT
jgi:BirA family biotin operon repressor/biotin-[acetyl-CoA-carboxylase] ligase